MSLQRARKGVIGSRNRQRNSQSSVAHAASISFSRRPAHRLRQLCARRVTRPPARSDWWFWSFGRNSGFPCRKTGKITFLARTHRVLHTFGRLTARSKRSTYALQPVPSAARFDQSFGSSDGNNEFSCRKTENFVFRALALQRLRGSEIHPHYANQLLSAHRLRHSPGRSD